MKGRILTVPLIEVRVGPTMTINTGFHLLSPNEDHKLRTTDLLVASNYEVGTEGVLSLTVGGDLGIKKLGLSTSFDMTLAEIELFSSSGSLADLEDPLSVVKEKILEKVNELANMLNPLEIASAIAKAVAQGLEDAGEWVGDQAEVIGKAADHAAKEAGKLVEGAVRSVSKAAKKTEQAVQATGDAFADLFGWGSWNSVNVPNRRTFSTNTLGSVLYVHWDSTAAESRFNNQATF